MKYNIGLDVTLSGEIEVEAESEKEAIEKIQKAKLTISDLKNFCFVKETINYVDGEEQ